MDSPTIHGKRPVYSASTALETIGADLARIKFEDRLTWADIGAVLGVSEDQAAKYADGTAAMSVVTYGRGKREWNGRFAGSFNRLCVDSRPVGPSDDWTMHRNTLALAMELALHLEDGHMSVEEVRSSRATMERLRADIDHQLARLGPSAAQVRS